MRRFLPGKVRLIKKRFKMSLSGSELPWGITFLQKLTSKCCPRLHFNRELCYKGSVVFLTYIAYMCYHMSRKPISVVKAVLHRNCSELTPPNPHEPSNWCDWAPFDGSDAAASQLLGVLDSAFLVCYAISMFISGFVAERVNLRYFLSLGMLLSGVFCYLFGLGKSYGIHNLTYYIIVQAMSGIFQTSGWPGVVTVMSNWFGKSKKGLIFGLWNSHTSMGNIVGSLIAGHYVESDWSLSFILPGLIMGATGFILFLFLVVNPNEVGFNNVEIPTKTDSNKTYKSLNASGSVSSSRRSSSDDDVDDTEILIGEQERRYAVNFSDDAEVQRRSTTERSRLLGNTSSESQNQAAIGFMGALRIPGVIDFSLCLFFSKLVNYTFLYWLPLYVSASTTMGATLSADLATLFDIGGIAGAIVSGLISDKTDMPASTCVGMLILAAPMMFIYQKLCVLGLGINMILLIWLGLLVNGPYALITTSVSAELGRIGSLEGNAKALATVTAIIDGTGSIGAAVGPLLAGFVSSYGWSNVFYMLIVSDILAMFVLLRLMKHEIIKYRTQRTRTIRIE